MKLSFNAFVACFLLISFQAVCQNKFPDIKGKTLNDKQISLPQSSLGKYTLIGMAYSRKAEEQLNTWFNPVYTTFIQQDAKSLFPTESYDVNIYFVPMITGIAQTAGDKIEDKMKKNIEDDLKPHVMLYEGEVKSYKETLKMADKEQPYFFVLDEAGKIIYSTSGAYTEKKMEQIIDKIEQD